MPPVKRMPAIVSGESLRLFIMRLSDKTSGSEANRNQYTCALFRLAKSARWPNRENSSVGLSLNGQLASLTSSLPDAVLLANADSSLRLQGMGPGYGDEPFFMAELIQTALRN